MKNHPQVFTRLMKKIYNKNKKKVFTDVSDERLRGFFFFMLDKIKLH
jgi:hypothetical protein